MAKKTWTLCNVNEDEYTEFLHVSADNVPGASQGYSVTKRTLRGGLQQGVDVVEVDNGAFRFVAVPTRGMGIWRAAMGDVKLGWNSPVRGPVHPSRVRLAEPSGLGWLDGFDELLVRCGLESNGAPEFDDCGILRYGLHGRIANIPAHQVELSVDGDSGEIAVTGTVDETRLFFNKLRMTTTLATRVGQPGMTIIDTVENLSAEPGELELLYHINFGAPLLSPGAKVVLPIARVAPRDPVAAEDVPTWDTYGPATPGSSESVFFIELAADDEGNTRTLLKNGAGDHGVSLKFNRRQLPHFTLWKNRQACVDGYVTGLEPGTNYPNIRSFEKAQGRVIELEPGEKRTFHIEIEVHADTAAVAAAERSVESLQRGTRPEVLEQPCANWSA